MYELAYNVHISRLQIYSFNLFTVPFLNKQNQTMYLILAKVKSNIKKKNTKMSQKWGRVGSDGPLPNNGCLIHELSKNHMWPGSKTTVQCTSSSFYRAIVWVKLEDLWRRLLCVIGLSYCTSMKKQVAHNSQKKHI